MNRCARRGDANPGDRHFFGTEQATPVMLATPADLPPATRMTSAAFTWLSAADAARRVHRHRCTTTPDATGAVERLGGLRGRKCLEREDLLHDSLQSEACARTYIAYREYAISTYAGTSARRNAINVGCFVAGIVGNFSRVA